MATEQTEQQRASVVVIKGHGEKRLRQAIMQGLLRDELIEDVQETLDDIERKRRELAGTQSALAEANKAIAEYRKVYHEALKAKHREEKRAAKFETVKMVSVICGCAFVIVFLSMLICRAILG